MLEDVLQIDYFFVYLSHQLIKPDRVGLFNVGKHSYLGSRISVNNSKKNSWRTENVVQKVKFQNSLIAWVLRSTALLHKRPSIKSVYIWTYRYKKGFKHSSESIQYMKLEFSVSTTFYVCYQIMDNLYCLKFSLWDKTQTVMSSATRMKILKLVQLTFYTQYIYNIFSVSVKS